MTDQQLAYKDGQAAHAAKKKRRCNPFWLPSLRKQWEAGWLEDQRVARNSYKREWRRRRKKESAPTATGAGNKRNRN